MFTLRQYIFLIKDTQSCKNTYCVVHAEKTNCTYEYVLYCMYIKSSSESEEDFYYKSGFEPGFPIVNPNTPNESLDTVEGLRYIVDPLRSTSIYVIYCPQCTCTADDRTCSCRRKSTYIS